MAGASSNEPGEVNSEINVTPMIDVLLVLLIIFMIVQLVVRNVVEIQIPPVDTGALSDAPSTQIVLELRDDGSYVINGTPHPKANLDQAFHTIYDQRPAKLLFIKPGQNRLYGDLIEAIDIAKGAGVEVVGLTPIEAN
jgi:biopolymer transport protein TolR